MEKVDFYVSKLFMVLLMHSGLIKLKEKLLVKSMFSGISFLLGWFWYFHMAFRRDRVSLSGEILVRPSIPGFWLIFRKYLLKIFKNLLSPESITVF